MSELFGRRIEVYGLGAGKFQVLFSVPPFHVDSFIGLQPLDIFQCQATSDAPPIRLKYHPRLQHYDSLASPNEKHVPTPPSPDLHRALQTSENIELENLMLEDKLRATDWEATGVEVS